MNTSIVWFSECYSQLDLSFHLLHEIFEGLLDACEAISSGHVQVKFVMEHHKHHGLKTLNIQEEISM